MLVIGRSYSVVPIQDEDVKTDAGAKLAEEITEKSVKAEVTELEETTEATEGKTGAAGTKSIAYRGGNSTGTKPGAFGTGL